MNELTNCSNCGKQRNPKLFFCDCEEYVEGVVLKGIDMYFMDMVMFMVKWSIASIPATIIITFIMVVSFVIFGILFGGFGWMLN